MKNFEAFENASDAGSSNERGLVASVNECMNALKIGRATLYELINRGELDSFRQGRSRKILWRSVDTYIQRRLDDEARRRNRAGLSGD
ncbi:helix-turn-helix domain-containing protein [Bradyrhizobium sp. CCBAU 53380]|uniref:helix-turn-helix domain-containing protein n=1 Tax=Bradyrhizobium sp. CCBAU 53380 TaxID=1325117 RepID=UPI002304C541|nr:helix-turn-helix domain-containing protein [Bradyrhizobium sp. CCBAU 53380]